MGEQERLRVLIAEDDAVVRLLLRRWLTAWGFHVQEAADGEQAWAILSQPTAPKLIVLDWEMPGLDGIELCRRIRQRHTPYYQYVLMVSGRSEMANVVLALESGADDCIAKPFEEAELKARLTVANRILDLQDELIAAREALRVQAMKDPLTGLWNRAAFQELFEAELDRAARSTDPAVGLLLLDVDHFKVVNDTYGHIAGDAVLRAVAQILRQNVRPYDFVGRFGGEEFLVAVPGCHAEELRHHAERVRNAVAHAAIDIGDAQLSITASIGATVSSAQNVHFDTLLGLADTAMYRAKATGRNATVFCDLSTQGQEKTAEKPLERCLTCGKQHSDHCRITLQ